MGGRRSVTTSYRKVERVKPKRRVVEPVVTFGEPYQGKRSPLTAYIEENRSSGLSIHELVEQFQEYDCDHDFVTNSFFPSPLEPEHLVTCEICAFTERRKGRGSRHG